MRKIPAYGDFNSLGKITKCYVDNVNEEFHISISTPEYLCLESGNYLTKFIAIYDFSVFHFQVPKPTKNHEFEQAHTMT